MCAYICIHMDICRLVQTKLIWQFNFVWRDKSNLRGINKIAFWNYKVQTSCRQGILWFIERLTIFHLRITTIRLMSILIFEYIHTACINALLFVGKTMFCLHLLGEWVNGDKLPANIRHIFYFALQNLTHFSRLSVGDLFFERHGDDDSGEFVRLISTCPYDCAWSLTVIIVRHFAPVTFLTPGDVLTCEHIDWVKNKTRLSYVTCTLTVCRSSSLCEQCSSKLIVYSISVWRYVYLILRDRTVISCTLFWEIIV